MRKQATLLILTSLAFWVAVSYPAFVLGGESALIYSAVALLLCLLPTVATLLWAGWAWNTTPEQQLTMILGGTGLRMTFVLGCGLLLYSAVPYFAQQSFWVWLLVFYLLTLALEMVLIVKTVEASNRNPAREQSP